MEAIEEVPATKAPTKKTESAASNSAPPEIITVDTSRKGDETQDEPAKQDGADDPSFRQARTPKHANKTMGARGEGASNTGGDGSEQNAKGSDEIVKPSFPKQKANPAQTHGAPPQSMGNASHPLYPGQGHPNQQGYFPRGGGDSFPSHNQRPPFEAGPRRQGTLTVGGHNGAFSPHDPQFRERESSTHTGYYSGGQPPTVSPGGPNGRDGGDYRHNAPYYGRPDPQQEYRNVPGNTGFPNVPYRPDGRGPPPQAQGYPPRDHRPYEQGSYGRHPGQFGGQPPPNLHAFHRGQHRTASASFQDQHRNLYAAQPPMGSQYQGRPPQYPQHPHVQPSAGSSLEFQNRQTPTQEKVHDQGYNADQGAVGGFTRAVSSSFDRSVRSKTSNEDSKTDDRRPPFDGVQKMDTAQDQSFGFASDHRASQGDNASEAPSDDSSWRQLNQVASVDEDAIRARLKEKEQEKNARNAATPTQNQETHEGRPGSNSSSLTNSPNDHNPVDGDRGHEGRKQQLPVPTPSKLASLDSLSSVASAQEPMDTEVSKEGKTRTGGPPSPGSSSASLDLMKCSSGSSGLLQGFPRHQRDGSDGSYHTGPGYGVALKRSREERDASSNKNASRDEPHRPPPEQVAKRGRHSDQGAQSEGKPGKDKNDDSKQDDLQGQRTRSLSDSRQPQGSHAKNASESNYSFTSSPGLPGGAYFDHPPSYSYSHDSGNESRKNGYPQLPPRPGSSASSTTIPPEAGLQMPSWDIPHAESFGAGSIGNGPQLMSSFSFQDYPGLGNSESAIGYSASHDHERASDGVDQHNQLPLRQAHSAPPHGRHDARPPPVAESRNQSFEGGHYHGSFDRSQSMDMGYSGEGHRPSGGQQGYGESYKTSQYQGQFPPHAPSWGTTTSTGSASHSVHAPHFRGAPQSQGGHGQYGQFQRNASQAHPSPRARHASHPFQNAMMRNYSEDSARTSPPPGPPGHHMGPHGPVRTGSMNVQSSFQPPPEFGPPQNPHLSRRPPPAVFIMSSPPGGHPHDPSLVPKRGPGGGVYSWTKEDDIRLTDIMKKYKNPRDWEPIAKEHGRGKTAKECHERWIRYLKPGVRKGQWQDHEDAIVVEAVTTSTEQPFTRWSDLAQRLPGRVGKQIRDRWVNHLNPNINHLPFSREDDLNLWEGHKKYGKRWVEISTRIFNCSRSENHIKNRWYSASFKKFIANEFGPDAYSGGKAISGKKDEKSKSKRVKAEETIAV